jgi:hypothetical protein
MAFYEAFTIEQLNRALTASKWLLVVCGIIFVCVAMVNQWLTGRIATLQREEKTQAQQRLKKPDVELQPTNKKNAEAAARLAPSTVPRRLSDEQIASLRKSLPTGPRGKVVITYLSVESDAQKYAEQIAHLLTETGFDVSMSKNVWLQLSVGGIFLCARNTSNAPAHAVHIQLCFQATGLRLRAHQNEKMYSDMSVPNDAIIFVVSYRERPNVPAD